MTDSEMVDLVADGNLAESGPEVPSRGDDAAALRPAPVSAEVPPVPLDAD